MIILIAILIIFSLFLFKKIHFTNKLNIESFKNITEDEILNSYIKKQKICFDLKNINLTYLSNKSILITGGCGSISKNLIFKLLSLPIKKIIILDNNENSLYNIIRTINSEYKNINIEIEYILDDVRNKHRLQKIFNHFKPNIIFHYANYKSIILGNISPESFVDVNIRGTKNLLDISIDSQYFENFVFISSDKAEIPTSIYGKTKRVVEILIKYYAKNNIMKNFTIFRYCNILDSAGSFAIPTFKKQILNNKKITIRTSEKNEIPKRYYITKKMAIDLTLFAGSMAKNGNILSINENYIKPILISDIANKVLSKANFIKNKKKWKKNNIQYIKFTKGEKSNEKLGIGKNIPDSPLIEITDYFELDEKLFINRLIKLLQSCDKNINSGNNVNLLLDNIISSKKILRSIK